MQDDNLLHWFYTNAPAAWISACIATVTLLIVLRSRTKPKRLTVREVGSSSLIRIWPRLRAKISLSFDGKPIEALGQIDLDISNSGTQAIQHPQFSISVPEATRILECHVSPEDSQLEYRIENNRLNLKLPHLNSFREHKQVVTLSILVDGKTTPLRVTGSGADWSMRHVQDSQSRKIWYDLSVLVAFFAISLIYSHWAGEKFSIREGELSWKEFLTNIPVLILAMASLSWVFMGRWKREEPRAWQEPLVKNNLAP